MSIKVNFDHKAKPEILAGHEKKHGVKITRPDNPKEKHTVSGSKENLRNFVNDVYDNYSPRNIHPELFKDEKLDEKVQMTQRQFANLDGNPKFTANDLAHAREKTHIKKAAAGTLEEDDTTSPSSMGIKKPNYAPAGTTPDYAKPTTQTVNRAAKTSLPAGTLKKAMNEEQLEEKAVSKAQHRFFGLVRRIQKGKTHGSAKAEEAAASMSAKSVKDYAKTKEKGLPEKISEASEGSQVMGQSQYGGNKPRPVSYGNIPAIERARERVRSGATGVAGSAMGSFSPAKPEAAATSSATRSLGSAAPKPADSKGTSAFTGMPNKSAPADSKGTSAFTGMPNKSAPADRPNDLGKAPVPGTGGRLAPKAPIPNQRPAGLTKPATKPAVKPVAKKPLTPVKKTSGRPLTRYQRDYVGPGGRT